MSNSVPFLNKTAKSSQIFQEAVQWIPGGVTANIKYFDPYPIIMKTADGAYLYDVDGNEYIDFNLCYGALILGHGHAEVSTALTNQLSNIGTSVFGTPHIHEIEMAKTLANLYPSIEKVRFTNSGLEATLLALRFGSAWSKKKKIAKFEGHYHGSHDQVLVGVNPNKRKAHEKPVITRDSLGLPDYYLENTILLPFNDIEQTAEILKAHQHEIATLIMEPIQGGFIPPDPEFLKAVRQLTEQYEIAFIMDEVKTGFRVSLSGAQGLYGVTPDITALGKVLGGGFPVGAVGGRKDIMDLSSPISGVDILSVDVEAKEKAQSKPLFHSGTYNGHPLIMTTGFTTIQILEKENTYQKLEENTAKLRQGIEQLCTQYGLPGQTVGVGSIFNLVFTEQPVKQVQDVINSDLVLREKLDGHLINRGIFVKPLNRFSMSVAHNQSIIDDTLERFEQAIKDMVGK